MSQGLPLIAHATCVLALAAGCSSQDGAAPTVAPPVVQAVCGSDVGLRRGYHHLRSSVSHGFNDLSAEIDLRSNAVAVDLSGWDCPTGSASVVIDCNVVPLLPGDGIFAAISLTCTSAHSLVIGGYGKASGKGVFVEFRFGFAGGEPSGASVTVSQRLLYAGCDFTYPDCLMHREGDELAYFYDVDRQAMCSLFLGTGEVTELATAAKQPSLQGTRYLVIGTARGSPGGAGILLSASSRPHYRSPPMSSPSNPIFHLADTNGDLSLNRFWQQP